MSWQKPVRNTWQKLYKQTQTDLVRPMSAEELAQPAMIFAPHQDDETLGCGGTILRKTDQGTPVGLVFLTDGSGSHKRWMSGDQLKAVRHQEALAAAQDLGVPSDCVHFLNFPDGHLKSFFLQAVARVVQLLKEQRPRQVFVPYRREQPADHVAANRIVWAAVEQSGLPLTVYEYPVWYWYQWPWVSPPREGKSPYPLWKTSFKAGLGLRLLHDFRCAVPVTPWLERKRQALSRHRSQMERLGPDPNWPTLGDVAGGDWLACFFQDHELFYAAAPLQGAA